MLVLGILLTIFLKTVFSDDIIVNTSQGSLKGTLEKSRNGSDIFAFYGIPYAEPPVGKLRLKVILELTYSCIYIKRFEKLLKNPEIFQIQNYAKILKKLIKC